MFNWAEDSVIRERLYVAAAEQGDYQLFKDALPGKPGGDGPQNKRILQLRARCPERVARGTQKVAVWGVQTRSRHRPFRGEHSMLRFLVTRLLSAIPVLLILSVVTFAIIQAPPGDYSDYIRSQLINLGARPMSRPMPKQRPMPSPMASISR